MEAITLLKQHGMKVIKKNDEDRYMVWDAYNDAECRNTGRWVEVTGWDKAKTLDFLGY